MRRGACNNWLRWLRVLRCLRGGFVPLLICEVLSLPSFLLRPYFNVFSLLYRDSSLTSFFLPIFPPSWLVVGLFVHSQVV